MISLWLYNLSKLNILLLVHVLILLQKVLEKKNQNRRLNETFYHNAASTVQTVDVFKPLRLRICMMNL